MDTFRSSASHIDILCSVYHFENEVEEIIDNLHTKGLYFIKKGR